MLKYLSVTKKMTSSITSRESKVIVIGAGLSGLAAAKELSQKGLSVTILEAQDRIGGRLRSNHSHGVYFDEGASWIHGSRQNPIMKLATKAGLKTVPSNENSTSVYDIGGREYPDKDFDRAEAKFFSIFDKMMKKGSKDKSFKSLFYELYPSYKDDRLFRFFLSTYVTSDTGDLDKLSSTLYDEGEDFGNNEVIVANGYDKISQYLAANLNIKLNERVSRIDYSEKLIKVSHSSGISEADYVIVTVPLGVLKMNRISFNPPLPEKKRVAVEKIGMNCYNKFMLVWDKVFWDDELFTIYTPETPDKFNYFVNINKVDSNAKALMTSAYAEYGRKTETMSDEAVVEEIMKHLRDIYGKNIPSPKAILRTKWQSNENTYGSFSYPTTETIKTHYSDLAEAINQKIFFAGEHTNGDYFGTTHGAYLSGLREAGKIWKLVSNGENKVPEDNKRRSVAIIGAGISGLAAGKKLKEVGFDVTILEARNKVGGRLRSNRSLDGFVFDEGASWIHGIGGNNPITKLAKEAGMTTVLSDDESMVIYDVGGKEISDKVFEKTEKEFYKVHKSMYKKGSEDKSFESVFKSLYPDRIDDRLWKYFLSTYLTFDCGDLDKLSSSLYYEGEEFRGEERIATNGYDTITNYLSEGLNVRLNDRVAAIDYTNDHITVKHSNYTTKADYVLVTVPLGVLKANTIQFTPPLPDAKQAAIKGVQMNCVNKFFVLFDRAFWDSEMFIFYTPEVRDKFNFFVNIHKINRNIKGLMTFAFADYARQSETMSDEKVIDDIMVHLKDIYGNKIPRPIKILRTKWFTDENTYGSYSFTAVGTKMRHFEDLAEDINDKVFFAGEHTNVDYFSTAPGAYLSGIREADKIISLSKKGQKSKNKK